MRVVDPAEEFTGTLQDLNGNPLSGFTISVQMVRRGVVRPTATSPGWAAAVTAPITGGLRVTMIAPSSGDWWAYARLAQNGATPIVVRACDDLIRVRQT